MSRCPSTLRAVGRQSLVLASAVLALALPGCSGGDPAAKAEPSDVAGDSRCADPATCPLGDLAADRGIRFGTALAPQPLANDPDYGPTIAEMFNAVTAERDHKWDVTQPERGRFDFSVGDTLVDFAEANDLDVRGHALVWDQAVVDAQPSWVDAIDDPDELDEVLEEHITTVMGHYEGRIPRWDVVNEPLRYGSTELYRNHFLEVLGADYLDRAFEIAHAADPSAELFLNETQVENSPERQDALVELVSGMVERRVPIDGVGLQAHLFNGSIEPGTVADLVQRFDGLGLDVAITELDVPLAADTAAARRAQSAAYDSVVRECLGTEGCAEITVWGAGDAYSWLDDFLRPATEPLLLDDDLQPKPVTEVAREAMADSPSKSG